MDSSLYYSPTLITKFLDSNLVTLESKTIPEEFNFPFIELLAYGKLNGVDIPEDELFNKLSFLYFEYVTITCVSHRDIDGLFSLLQLSQLQDFGLVLDSTKSKLIPRFNKVVGSLILQSISLVCSLNSYLLNIKIDANLSVRLYNDWFKEAQCNNFYPKFNIFYQSKGFPLLSHDIILPALVVSCSAINSGLFSIDLILLLTSEYERLQNLNIKQLRSESIKEIENDKLYLKKWLGQIYCKYISSYIKNYSDKDVVFKLITEAIKNGNF